MVPVAVPAVVFSVGLLWAWTSIPVIPIYGTLWILLICYLTIFLPYGIRAISATLVQIDKSLEECASVMGASWGRVLRTITFPLLAPGLWAGWAILFISVTKELTASALLYNSKTVVLSVAVFDLWAHSSFTNVAALSLIQAAVIFAALFLSRLLGRARGAAA
jgi:iron(III) transport system permease protein